MNKKYLIMEDGSSTLNTMPETSSSTDFDLMDELLYDGFWLEATDGSDSWQLSPNSSSFTAFDIPDRETNIESEPNLGSAAEMDEISAVQSTRLWFGPNRNSVDTISVNKRLVQAIDCLKDSIVDKDVLVQMWVPVNRGGRRVLTTNDQPFSLNPRCKNLADYRNVSRNYHFSTDADSKEFFGLPGRVFLNKCPDWTPDVRFFKREEYPRVNYAQQHDVRGSLALPVFERGSGICLGVVEIVATSQKVNFSPELENVCNALEAVNLMSSNIQNPCNTEDQNGTYRDSLTEIRKVLRFICDAHKLPLAQTWASCVRQRKGGCRHSDENYACCVSTIDSACYVADEQVCGFHEACSRYHLLKGEGVVGKAFLTNQPCFAEDITAYCKTEYPLAHHARVFNLRASVAIRLRSADNGGTDDFVLEFFLPLNCKDSGDKKLMLNSVSSSLQKTCGSLHVITDEELARESLDRERGSDSVVRKRIDYQDHPSLVKSPPKENDDSARIMNVMDAQHNGEEFNFSWTNHGEGSDKEVSGSYPLTTGRDGRTRRGKRRTMMKKTISLEVLRQYYAGSLKEAAMSIGVCPTTLKRICRQHGITRWPSRKIKNVGNSLRKLQPVVDSVQGAGGAIQLGSFYNNLPGSSHLPASESPSLSGSGNCSSNNTSYDCSTGIKKSSLSAEQSGVMLKRSQSEAQLHGNVQQGRTKLLVRSYSHKNLSNNSPTKAPAVEKITNRSQQVDSFRVKAAFGEEKIRFRLQPQWGYEDLKQEVFGRFNIENGSSFKLKYLDDDAEWVLLTCDADLEECTDIHRSSNAQSIKLSVNESYHPHLGSSFGSDGSY